MEIAGTAFTPSPNAGSNNSPIFYSNDGGSTWELKDIIAGTPVVGPTNTTRFLLSFPAYTGYTYEIYGNPTLGALAWSALPFSLSQTGTINTNKFTATTNGTLHLFLEEKAAKGFYYVSFRVPGANTGTP